MANERVSQLQDLFASDMDPSDLFLVTDVSMKESKRMNMGQLLSYIEGSGSFDAAHSTNADTASYVEPSAIDGTVATALNASSSVSASAAVNARSSSYAFNSTTASYSAFCVVSQTTANSASYLIYTGIVNGTASYAVQALNANVATTALNLNYNGTPNGTASFAITASNVATASNAITASNANLATLATTASHALVSDNTVQSISSSYANQTDNAATASYISNAFYGPKFIAPITIASSTGVVPWTQFNCPVQFIPIGTRAIIVDAYTDNGSTNSPSFVQIAQQASTTGSFYIVTAYKTAGGGDNCTFGGQACGPCSSSNSNSSSFYYTFTGVASGGTVLRLIGYY